MHEIRVLHCPTTVGGNPHTLARAERELGLHSWSVAFKGSSFNYDADEVLFSDNDGQLLFEARRWRLLWRAVKDFDVIHFNFGQSIMPMWYPRNAPAGRGVHWLKREAYRYYARVLELSDLSFLKRAGKGIVVTYQGDDARQGDFCSASFEVSPAPEVGPGYYSPESDAHKRYRIGIFTRYADRIFALNPDLLHVLPREAEFLPYANIDLRDWKVVGNGNPTSGVPLIVHAPSHRGVKGTRFVVDAISRLQGEGVALEFILVEGLRQSQARKVYEGADLLIDQLLCGWYGGLAVEFMALGKPVICYIRDKDLKFLPPQMCEELPVINATPATVYDVIKQCLTVRRHELPELGRRSRCYVEKWHDPLRIAGGLKNEYEIILNSKVQRRHE